MENNNIHNKSSKKFIFHINDKNNNNDIYSESYNNELSDKNNNQFLAPLKPSSSKRKLLFATYRDPSRENHYEIINTENSRNSLIDLREKKKKHISDFNSFENDNDNEDDFIHREIELIEDKNEEPGEELNNYNNYKIDEKELDNFEKF